MKNLIFIFLAVGLFFSCSHKTYDSLSWQSNKVTADGVISEWENPLRFYDEKSKINYIISNDRDNLYVCLKVSDETEKIKILRAGLEFRIDTTGGKSFPIALVFPMPQHMQYKRKNTTGADSIKKLDRSEMVQKLISQEKEMQLIGFKPPLGGIASLALNTTDISAAVNIDGQGILYYEAIIPFKTFYQNELSFSDTNKVFNYEIKVNALPAPPMRGGGEGHQGGGMGGGGMAGGMHGGGMHGGGGGHHGGGNSGGGGYSSGGNSEMYVKNIVITKMRLSCK